MEKMYALIYFIPENCILDNIPPENSNNGPIKMGLMLNYLG